MYIPPCKLIGTFFYTPISYLYNNILEVHFCNKNLLIRLWVCKDVLYKVVYFYTGSIIQIKGDFMKNRKQHVINMAHQLFIEKGSPSDLNSGYLRL